MAEDYSQGRFSHFRLGMKTLSNDEHWTEDFVLDPKKKTILTLGGGGTFSGREANGNNNDAVQILGLTNEENEQLQLVSCYRRKFTIGDGDGSYVSDFKRQIWQHFRLFMAHKIDGMYERLTGEELAANFRNLMVQAHCAGANDLPLLQDTLQHFMTKLGYNKAEQKYALRQIICLSNNSQREMTDNLQFSAIHRYSVTDGQTRPTYKKDESDGYPVLVGEDKDFSPKKGNKAAFVELQSNEILMVFDKIMVSQFKKDEWRYIDREAEHNEAFWTTEIEDLTPVGRAQALLMRYIGRFWYDNSQPMPRLNDLLRRLTADTPLKSFVARALALGRRVKADKNNLLVNHRILRNTWQNFTCPWGKVQQNGAYKLLSEDAKAKRDDADPLYYFLEKFHSQGKKSY